MSGYPSNITDPDILRLFALSEKLERQADIVIAESEQHTLHLREVFRSIDEARSRILLITDETAPDRA